MVRIHLLLFTLRLVKRNMHITSNSPNHRNDTTLQDFIRVQHSQVSECLIQLHQLCRTLLITRLITLSTTIRILEDILLLLSISMELQHFSNKMHRGIIMLNLTPTITNSNQFLNSTNDFHICPNSIHNSRRFNRSVKERKEDRSMNLDLARKGSKTENLSRQKFSNLSSLMTLNQWVQKVEMTFNSLLLKAIF